MITEDHKLKYYYAVFIPVFFVGAYLMFNDYVSSRSELYAKYPLVLEKHGFECEISSSKKDKSACLITGTEGNSFRIEALSEEDILFTDFAEAGDSIYKKSESNLVVLVKSNGERLEFMLR